MEFVRLLISAVFVVEFPNNNVFVTIRVDSTWTYNISIAASLLESYNFTVNGTNDVTLTSFVLLRNNTPALQLVGVILPGTFLIL